MSVNCLVSISGNLYLYFGVLSCRHITLCSLWFAYSSCQMKVCTHGWPRPSTAVLIAPLACLLTQMMKKWMEDFHGVFTFMESATWVTPSLITGSHCGWEVNLALLRLFYCCLYLSCMGSWLASHAVWCHFTSGASLMSVLLCWLFCIIAVIQLPHINFGVLLCWLWWYFSRCGGCHVSGQHMGKWWGRESCIALRAIQMMLRQLQWLLLKRQRKSRHFSMNSWLSYVQCYIQNS